MTDPRGEGDYLDLIIPQSVQWPKTYQYTTTYVQIHLLKMQKVEGRGDGGERRGEDRQYKRENQNHFQKASTLYFCT